MESILWVDSEYYGLLVKLRRYTQFGTYRTQSHEGPLNVSPIRQVETRSFTDFLFVLSVSALQIITACW